MHPWNADIPLRQAVEGLVRQMLTSVGGGRVLSIGDDAGRWVAALLNRGVDAWSASASAQEALKGRERAGDRLLCISSRCLPFSDGAFDGVVCTDLANLSAQVNLDEILQELRRVVRRFIFAVVPSSVDPQLKSVSRRDRTWWETRFFDAGFRKHPLLQTVVAYETLEREPAQITLIFEKVPDGARRGFPTERLEAERLLHMDMLRDTGRRSEAHVARYTLALPYVRPGDVVLDVACGLGYGTAILAVGSPAARIIGVDSSSFAIEYARANYGHDNPAVEFHEADAGALAFLSDASVDFAISLETLEHLSDPGAFLRELDRVLKPGGRLLVSVPNEWVDESGDDPNPHHLHVYTWARLRGELERHFRIEKRFAQVAGGALKLPDGRRRLQEMAPDAEPSEDPEWWLALAMKPPVGAEPSGFRESSYPDYSDLPDYHITAFGRDYDNPWLVKAMVAIGMRCTNDGELERMAQDVVRVARPGSADAGAALCVLAYRLLEDDAAARREVEELLSRIDAYAVQCDDTAHAWRWRISNEYAAARLLLKIGRRREAERRFVSCADLDPIRFSPLLATKTVDALYQAGLLAAFDHRPEDARVRWTKALEETRRVLQGDWVNVWGRAERPVSFGLPEVAQLADMASRANYGLTVLDDWPRRPGFAWTQLCRNRADEISRLRAEVRELRAWGNRLERSLGEPQDVRDDFATTVRALQQRLADADARHRKLHTWTETLDRLLTERTMQLQDAEARLTSITNSTGWRLLQVLYRVRFFLCPRGSRREAAGRWLMHKQRRVRFYGRQGLGPLAAATGRWLRRLFVRALRWGVKNPLPYGRGSDKRRAAAGARTAAGARGKAGTGVQLAGARPGLVSVILPVFNQADLLAESIESVLAQTYQDFELIVLNDGSTDEVEAVLDRYADHPKVRVLSQANQKLPKALSNAFEFATGEFWTWTSADNLMEPLQLERQVAFLRAHPDAGMVYCDYLAIDDRGEPLRDPSFRSHNRRSPTSPEIHLPRATDRLNTVPDNFVGACFMYRGWIGRLLGDYAPDMGIEDYDYWMRINGFFCIRHLGTDDVLYRYRVHDNSLNARAVEHRIHERLERLMQVERDRQAFVRRPWTIFTDAATRDWLCRRRIDTGRHAVRRLDARTNGKGDGPNDKTMMLVRIDALAEAAAVRPAGRIVIGWWDDADLDGGRGSGDARRAAPYERRAEIGQVADLCLCGDGETASRLAMFCPRTLIAPADQSRFDLAVTFADDAAFFRQTYAPDQRRRQLPRLHVPHRQRLRALIQVDSLVQGGLEQVVLDVASAMDPDRTEVAILVLGQQGPAAAKARAMGLTIIAPGAGDPDAAYRSAVSDWKPSVINAHHSLAGAAIVADMGIPFVQTIHNTYVWLPPEQIAAYRAADAHTAAYLCVSANVACYSDVRLGLPADKMLIVPNGIDTARLDAVAAGTDRATGRAELGWSDDDFVFLNCAAIYPPKAQLPLVRALAEAVRVEPRIRVALLGRVLDEPYHQRVRQAIGRSGLERHVCFLGYHAEAARYYYLADAFVLPSYWEGWSLALMEALWAGLPAVATDVGAARELLRACGGELVSPPFDSIVELDAGRLPAVLDAAQPVFVRRLSEALVRTARDRRRPVLPGRLRETFDRSAAYRAYRRVFEWLAAGGCAASARPWLRAFAEAGDSPAPAAVERMQSREVRVGA